MGYYYKAKQTKALTRKQMTALTTLLGDHFAVEGYNEDPELVMKDYELQTLKAQLMIAKGRYNELLQEIQELNKKMEELEWA